MARVHDVAAYLVQRSKRHRLTALKMQKLIYYSQAWHLVWEGRPLFMARIEAWEIGPVVPMLYREHRGQFTVKIWPKGNPRALDNGEIGSVDAVMDFYGPRSTKWLSDLTYLEDPWNQARERAGVSLNERCGERILLADMVRYYSSLEGNQSW